MLPGIFVLFSFPCLVDHERDWLPYEIRVGSQNAECEKQQQQQQQLYTNNAYGKDRHILIDPW